MMERVIFLDRDGTLNREVNYLHRPEDLEFLPGVAEALRRFRDAGYRIVVVTNQAGVARGYYGEKDVELLHAYMNDILRRQGAGIDAFFYCPHHPEHGIGKYKKECRCRKPGTGMFEMAEKLFEIDKAHSWMIGDKLIDVQAGINYGVHTVLVGTGYGAGEHAEELKKLSMHQLERLPYDIYAETMADAAQEILARTDIEKRGCIYNVE